MKGIDNPVIIGASLDIAIYPNPLLTRVSEPVREITNEIRLLCQKMIESVQKADGAGLAAVQVGVLKRLIVINLPVINPGGAALPLAMIDPVMEKSDGQIVGEEGCLSMPGIFTNIPRPEKVVTSYTDIDGYRSKISCEGFFARCVAHEVDHLDGILFWDKLGWIKRESLKIRQWRNRL